MTRLEQKRLLGLCRAHDRSFAMGVIAVAALTGIICAVLYYLNQRQEHDILAAILTAGAILFAAVCDGLVILR